MFNKLEHLFQPVTLGDKAVQAKFLPPPCFVWISSVAFMDVQVQNYVYNYETFQTHGTYSWSDHNASTYTAQHNTDGRFKRD
jgi:hypothetical protein